MQTLRNNQNAIYSFSSFFREILFLLNYQILSTKPYKYDTDSPAICLVNIFAAPLIFVKRFTIFCVSTTNALFNFDNAIEKSPFTYDAEFGMKIFSVTFSILDNCNVLCCNPALNKIKSFRNFLAI